MNKWIKRIFNVLIILGILGLSGCLTRPLAADITALEGTTGYIGKEDINWGTGLATDTFTVTTYDGGSATLTKIPDTDAVDESVIKGVWYVAAMAGDHGNAALTGSLAWVIAVLDGDPATVVMPGNQTYQISTDLTVPATVCLVMHRGAIFSVDVAKTLTINGLFEAGLFQVFSGTGTVAFDDVSAPEYYPEWFGAVADGTTDDGVEIRALLAAMPAGGKISFNQGTYAVTGTTGIPITISLHWYMNSGSKLLFSDDATVYVKPDSVTGLIFENLTIDAGAPAVRGIEAALYLMDCSETFVTNLRVLSAAGTGYICNGGADHHISNSHVNDTLADGFHWTDKATRFTGTNLTTEDTGDDSFAIIGYSVDGGRVTEGLLTGLVAHDSAADMLRIAGGDGIVVSGFYGKTSTVHGIIIGQDDTYNTYSSQNCVVKDVVLDSVGSQGVVITNDANDITVEATIINPTGRGFNIGASGNTIERITVSGSVYSAGEIGFQADYVDRLSIPYMNAYNCATHGIFLGTINELSAGLLQAYNNNTNDDGTSDNINIDGVVNGVFATIQAHDDNGTAKVDKAVEVVNADFCSFGPVEYSGYLNAPGFEINQTNCTNLYMANAPVSTFASADATPSVVGSNLCKTSNGAGTVITMLDQGRVGKVVKVIIGDANTTIDFTGTNLKGNAGVDWSPGSGDWMECVFDGTDWYCSVHDTTS